MWEHSGVLVVGDSGRFGVLLELLLWGFRGF